MKTIQDFNTIIDCVRLILPPPDEIDTSELETHQVVALMDAYNGFRVSLMGLLAELISNV